MKNLPLRIFTARSEDGSVEVMLEEYTVDNDTSSMREAGAFHTHRYSVVDGGMRGGAEVIGPGTYRLRSGVIVREVGGFPAAL